MVPTSARAPVTTASTSYRPPPALPLTDSAVRFTPPIPSLNHHLHSAAVTQLGPSSVPTKKRAVHCTRGYTTCPHWSGRGGMDCIDTRSNVESCGGCVSVSPEDAGEGTDCTAIPGVSIANCVRSQCVVGPSRLISVNHVLNW